MKYKLKEFDYYTISPLFIKDFEREEIRRNSVTDNKELLDDLHWKRNSEYLSASEYKRGKGKEFVDKVE